MALVSHFNGSKKRKVPARKPSAKDVPSARVRSTHLAPFWPHNHKDIQELYGRQLVEWSKQETAMEIDDFFNEKQISAMKFFDACKTNAFLDECKDIALANIGARLRKRVEQESYYINKMLPQYLSVLRLERKQKMEAEQNNVVQKTYEIEKVIMPIFTNKKE